MRFSAPFRLAAAAVLGLVLGASGAAAQVAAPSLSPSPIAALPAGPEHLLEVDFELFQDRGIRNGETYRPTIWVDPDGCEHWVMDDGVEGYMTPHVNRQGIPVCRRVEACGVVSTDQLFATDSYRIHRHAQQSLAQFFRSASATSFIIIGHTDSRASDAYNMRLSYNRANAVAAIAARSGARIADVRGMGERAPRASNATHHGMAQNRRVEIICIR